MLWTAVFQIEFVDGASWIWHHHDFRLQQDRPQAPLSLEYGNFTQEILEVEDPEYMVGLGRRLPKRPRFLSLGLAFLAVLIVPAAIYGGGGDTGIGKNGYTYISYRI